MKKYMLVFILEGKQEANFYDDRDRAVHDADILMNCLGGYGEVYERQTPTEENDYEDGYTMIYCG